MTFRNVIRFTAIVLSTSIVYGTAQAKVHMNAMCFMTQNQEVAQAFNPTKEEIAQSGSAILKNTPTNVTDADVVTPYRIASLSKVFTSHWALMTLGPEYRFTTKIHITPGTSKTTCNMHFEGDGDPILGRDALGAVFPDLKIKLSTLGCSKVETVTFDEQFRVLLDVLSHRESTVALKTYGWSNPSLYENAGKTKADLTRYLQYKSGLNVNLEKVGFVSKSEYSEYLKQVSVKTYSFKSRPLFRILKELNKYSHNYITNVIFSRLGGAEAYKTFIANRLNLNANNVFLLNGSGYPVTDSQGVKTYNVASCNALVSVIRDIDKSLTAYKGVRVFQIADILPIGGPSETYSTFKGNYSSATFDNTIAAKTGSADKAITFGGVLSTTQGNLYFGVLTAPDNYSAPDLPDSRDYIRQLMGILAERVTLIKFDYEAAGPMLAIDDEIKLKDVSVSPATTVTLK